VTFFGTQCSMSDKCNCQSISHFHPVSNSTIIHHKTVEFYLITQHSAGLQAATKEVWISQMIPQSH